MFLSQHVLHTPAVRLRAIATPHVNAATLRSSCIVHGKTTAAQVKEREMIEASLSDLGTPVVDYLLETSPYSQFLDDNAITSMRDREKSLGDAATGEKLRRLRIAFANKGRRPWNAGKSHKPDTIARIREGVAKAMKDPAVIAKLRNKYIPQTPESRARINEKIKLRVGWRRSAVYSKRDLAKRKVRRKLTKEELKASRERARQRCADAMKKKWQDPEYRARQEQAIRASHKANPRRPRTTRERAPTTTQPRTRRKKLPPLQKRLRSDKKAFEDTLQELQQTRAYCAKFEGVVSKLQAQADSLESQPEAQNQVQQALDGVLASRDKARDTISALEKQVAKLQAQVESTQLALVKQQRLAAEPPVAEAEKLAAPISGPKPIMNASDSGGFVGVGVTDASGLNRAPHATNGGPQGQVAAEASSDGGVGSASLRGAGPTGASRSHAAEAGAGPGNSDSPTHTVDTPSALQNTPMVNMPGGSLGNGAGASAAGELHEPARADSTVPAQRPLAGQGGHVGRNGSGNGMGLPETGSASPNDSVGANHFNSSAFDHHSVDLDRLTGVADGGGSLAIPTAAEWKKKLFDTSQNGHVVTGTVSYESSLGDTDSAAGTGGAGSGLLVQLPPAVSLDPYSQIDPRASREVVSGSAVRGQAVDDSGEEEDDQSDSLSWLREREHKLPWQQ